MRFRTFAAFVTVAHVAFSGFGCRSAVGPSPVVCSGTYPSQSETPYVLPWPVGQAFVVSQGNCGAGPHAAGTLVQYAYDILMPIGSLILAARSGVVLLVEERYVDGTRIPGQENYINIRHDDGTIAGYVHLTRDGALVEVGQSIERGQPIGLSGDTGSSAAPHLHFHVQAGPDLGTVPVTFRNTEPHPRGLREGQLYAALPW